MLVITSAVKSPLQPSFMASCFALEGFLVGFDCQKCIFNEASLFLRRKLKKFYAT